MGNIVNAKCECGFEANRLFIGCGMSMTYYAPAVCLSCKTIDAKEYYARNGDSVRKHTCKQCHEPLHFLDESGFFSPPDLANRFPDDHPWEMTPGTNGGTSRKNYPEVRYVCPKCRTLKLAFEKAGLWD